MSASPTMMVAFAIGSPFVTIVMGPLVYGGRYVGPVAVLVVAMAIMANTM